MRGLARRFSPKMPSNARCLLARPPRAPAQPREIQEDQALAQGGLRIRGGFDSRGPTTNHTNLKRLLDVRRDERAGTTLQCCVCSLARGRGYGFWTFSSP